MTVNLTLKRLVGGESLRRMAETALRAGRFPHALAVKGPPGVGHAAALLDLASWLACTDAAKRPCGVCPACLALSRGDYAGAHWLIPLKTPSGGESDGKLSDAQMEELTDAVRRWRESPYLFAIPEGAEVRIQQIRHLLGRLAFAETAGRARLVLIPWLEALRAEAANALLKTLEEPPADTYFLIGTENPSALLPTLLSRCLQATLTPLSDAALAEAASALAPESDLRPAWIPLAEGSPGRYAAFLQPGGDEAAEDAARFFALLARREWLEFLDWVEESEAFATPDKAQRLATFCLAALRLALRLRALQGEPPSGDSTFRWTAAALEKSGADAALTPLLGPLEAFPDLEPVRNLFEGISESVRGRVKPANAALGAYLEWEEKQSAGQSA